MVPKWSSNAVVNRGTMEATGGGQLVIESDVANTGSLQVGDGPGTTVTLENGITISGGTMTIGNGGAELAIANVGSNTGFDAALNGVAVASGGTIQVGSVGQSATLNLGDGTGITGGSIALSQNSTLAVTDISQIQGASLSGVSVSGGNEQPTWTPYGLSSPRRLSRKPRTANFVGAYAV